MPAVKSSRVHPRYKTEYRVRNWREYERGLRDRVDVTIWFGEKAIDPPPPSERLRRRQRRADRESRQVRELSAVPGRSTGVEPSPGNVSKVVRDRLPSRRGWSRARSRSPRGHAGGPDGSRNPWKKPRADSGAAVERLAAQIVGGLSRVGSTLLVRLRRRTAHEKEIVQQ